MKIEIAYPKLFINDKLVGYLKEAPRFFENHMPKDLYRGKPAKVGYPPHYDDSKLMYTEQLVCEVDLLADNTESLLEKKNLPHKLDGHITNREKEEKLKVTNRKIKI